MMMIMMVVIVPDHFHELKVLHVGQSFYFCYEIFKVALGVCFALKFVKRS